MTQTKSIDDRQKKFLLVLPLIALPFLVLIFWALGGGKNAMASGAKNGKSGLNVQVPGAKLKNDSAENKLSLYQEAEKDSLKFRQAAKNDPYYHADTPGKAAAAVNDTGIIGKRGIIGSYQPFVNKNAASTAKSLSANEQMINQQLAQLKQQVNQPPVPAQNTEKATLNSTQLQQLQTVVQASGSSNAPDPQLQQLSQMLDKIKDIQNPGLARDKMKAESEKNRGQVFPVTTGRTNDPLSTLDNDSGRANSSSNGFFSLTDQQADNNNQNAIEAVVAETQTLVSGSTVKLRIANDVFVNGRLIPKNTFVNGTAELSGERLEIKIKSIRFQKSLFPVSLSVYDMDGLGGICVPGAITRDVAKESADQSVQSMGVLNYDPSLGAQAANAGITAAKTLFSRKVRLVKVTVKAGYQVLLKDDKQQQNNQ